MFSLAVYDVPALICLSQSPLNFNSTEQCNVVFLTNLTFKVYDEQLLGMPIHIVHNHLQGCPKSSATLSILFSQNPQEMSAIFSVVNFECPTWYCTGREQYVLSHIHRGFSKWLGMVMCI